MLCVGLTHRQADKTYIAETLFEARVRHVLEDFLLDAHFHLFRRESPGLDRDLLNLLAGRHFLAELVQLAYRRRHLLLRRPPAQFGLRPPLLLSAFLLQLLQQLRRHEAGRRRPPHDFDSLRPLLDLLREHATDEVCLLISRDDLLATAHLIVDGDGAVRNSVRPGVGEEDVTFIEDRLVLLAFVRYECPSGLVDLRLKLYTIESLLKSALRPDDFFAKNVYLSNILQL